MRGGLEPRSTWLTPRVAPEKRRRSSRAETPNLIRGRRLHHAHAKVDARVLVPPRRGVRLRNLTAAAQTAPACAAPAVCTRERRQNAGGARRCAGRAADAGGPQGARRGDAAAQEGDAEAGTPYRSPHYPPRVSLGSRRSLHSHHDPQPRQVPLASMFFCILFSYTILRDTKDVLVRASTCPAPALLCPCDAETSGSVDQSTPCNHHRPASLSCTDSLSCAASPARLTCTPSLSCTASLTCAASPAGLSRAASLSLHSHTTRCLVRHLSIGLPSVALRSSAARATPRKRPTPS